MEVGGLEVFALVSLVRLCMLYIKEMATYLLKRCYNIGIRYLIEHIYSHSFTVSLLPYLVLGIQEGVSKTGLVFALEELIVEHKQL